MTYRDLSLLAVGWFLMMVAVFVLLFFPIAHGLIWQIPAMVIGASLTYGVITQRLPIYLAPLAVGLLCPALMTMAESTF